MDMHLGPCNAYKLLSVAAGIFYAYKKNDKVNAISINMQDHKQRKDVATKYTPVNLQFTI